MHWGPRENMQDWFNSRVKPDKGSMQRQMTGIIISASLATMLLMKNKKTADRTVTQRIFFMACKRPLRKAVCRGRFGMASRAWRSIALTLTLFWALSRSVSINLLHVSLGFSLGWRTRNDKQNREQDFNLKRCDTGG